VGELRYFPHPYATAEVAARPAPHVALIDLDLLALDIGLEKKVRVAVKARLTDDLVLERHPQGYPGFLKARLAARVFLDDAVAT
jgi:hypothetical protein